MATLRLFGLPDDILTKVLINWIDMVHIAKFDSACCNKAWREQYISLISSGTFVLKRVYGGNQLSAFLLWQALRKVKSTSFIVDEDVDVSILSRLCNNVGGGHVHSIDFRQIIGDLGAPFASLNKSCQKLRHISVDTCSQTLGLGALLFSSSATLKSLYLGSCELSSIVHLGNLSFPRLESLYLEGNYTTEVVRAILQGCAQLSTLYLREVPVDDSCLALLTLRAQQLSNLEVNCCPLLTDNALVALAGHCSMLTQLALIRCPELTDATVVGFCTQCPVLEAIMLDGLFTNEALTCIATSCAARLHHLSLINLEEGIDEGLVLLTTHCTSLLSLEISYIVAANDVVARFFAAQKQVEQLSVKFMDIDDTVMDAIASLGSRLDYLDLYDSYGFSSVGVEVVVRACTGLREVGVKEDHELITATVCAVWGVFMPRLVFFFEHCRMPYWEYNSVPEEEDEEEGKDSNGICACCNLDKPYHRSTRW